MKPGVVAMQERKYRFSWDLLGDLELGRPNLGNTTRVEVYRLGEDGLWSLFDMSDGPLVELATIGARIALDAVFDGMGST